ncbi:NADH:flavin oxidoreductase/NADH oxidase [Chelativorans sp. AA-79]|uniref:NADH:flavin oxidoreductase/NADH oxidase n=1 Tax=Chelativorans sp. AA-79 TaxID=3028735 RepID=UPI0023F852DB|nr:NADH:flavin oxidoreductase/NADH oxidase [Chelativorans sp. AA-79]WEX09800.1 NADH:flavin oxidoreductase/NADH oxidase [Chelativorans sp. AA-79]
MSALFSPFTLKELTLANRIVVSPMCQYSAEDGSATDWHLAHLGTLSASGAGALIVEATAVEREGRITHGDLGLYNDANEEALARILVHCRAHGSARLGIQIGHAGRKASAHKPWDGGRALGVNEDPWTTIAPSALAFGEGWHVPREMDEADLERVKVAHVEAARRAERLGFDLLEVHAAHGYLLHQFLSPISNHRIDGYGGSAENRMRFPLEVVRAVRAVWPEGRPLGLRITGRDWMQGGIELEDAVTFANRLKQEGVDFVCASSGGVAPNAVPRIEPGYQIPFAERVKRETGLPTRAVGLISTPKQAEAIISEGRADMIALGRAFLDNPHWGWLAARALNAEIERPVQYQRAADKVWPGAAYADAN